jgi:hypothetical protein
MARSRGRDYRAVHAAARKIEPRLARALERGLARLRGRASLAALARALAKEDVRGALALLLSPEAVRDALTPAGEIKRDAFARGRKMAAAEFK